MFDVLEGVSSLIGTIGGLAQGEKALAIEKQNLGFQQQAFEQTYANQIAQQEYAKELQKTIFAREDNAVQRRVADLKAAGLSPVLAAGQSARAGDTVSIPGARREPAQRGTQGLLMRQAAYGQLAEVGKTIAETSLIAAQAKATDAERRRQEELHPARVKQALVDLRLSEETVDNMIDKATYEAYQAGQDASKAEALRRQEWIDYNLKNCLVDWLKANYPGKKADSILSEKSPVVQDYMLKALALQLMEHDVPMLTAMPFPSSALNTGLSSLLGILR